MPVSNPDIVDAVAISALDGAVELHMFEERDWLDVNKQLREIQDKVNSYIRFAFGGQLAAQYGNRPIRFVLNLQYSPPDHVRNVCQALAEHLQSHKISTLIVVGTADERR